MKPYFLTFSFIATLVVNDTRGQSYSSVHYNTKDGLPSATVYDITQDINGFIWFGTENGLSRFDGKNFTTFTTKDGLPDNSILKVHADNSGRVYFAPFTHSLYYFENDSFYKFPIPEKYREDLAEISILTNNEIDLVASGTFETYRIHDKELKTLHETNNRIPPKVLVNNSSNSIIIAGTPDSFYLIRPSGDVTAVPYDTLHTFMFDSSGRQTVVNYTTYSNFRIVGYIASNLFYWAWGDTLRLLNCATGKIVFQTHVDKFSKAFVDNESNLWITTLGNGVYRLPSFGFRSIDFGGNNEIFSIVGVDDQLLAGTDYSKLFVVRNKEIGVRYSTTDLSEYINYSDNPISYSTKRNRVYVLHSEGENLYIGTDAFLLKKTGSSKPIFKKIFPVKDIDVSGKRVLVCTSRGVLLLDDQDMSIKDTLLKQRSTCGVCYHGAYYIGTVGGLISIDSATKKTSYLSNSISSLKGRITAIKRGIDDDLWIATSGAGLIHFKSDSLVGVLKEKDGLTSDICTSLCIDGKLIWLGTNNGLNRIDTDKGKIGITRFTSANGLGADFINAVLATDSSVSVGTAGGLTIFRKTILSEKSVCMLHILQVSENGNLLPADSSYTFPYNVLNIQIDFTAVSFKSAGDIIYSYKLLELDNKWNSTTANFVNFPTLPPGRYTLLLQATNKFGVLSNIKTLSIRILPPWWQTWPFRIMALATIALFVLFVYRFNVRNIKRKETAKREIEARFAALEQQALQAQMNPHFIFNCLNSIQTFILNFDAEGANNYLTTFASLIRQTLDNSMQPLISVASELKYLETYLDLEKLRFRDKFRYVIYVDDDIDITNTMLPGMLLQPYVENSLRHGIQHRKDNEGLISVNVKKTEDHGILYAIRDNGVGRKKAVEMRSTWHIEYQSRGTTINEKRIAAINNQYNTHIWVKTTDIIDEKGTVTGTFVSVHIPTFHK